MPALLRLVKALEQCIETLDQQYANCEMIKLDCAGLKDKKTPDALREEFLAFTTFNMFQHLSTHQILLIPLGEHELHVSQQYL